ncbi:MAG: SNF2-related protein [Candidatus Cloacimonas sp.]|jgi:adenine-specific DNA-methyltransferase|nr:SNF2-related protein [Candidatus Cloacimonas sp.]
MSLTNYHSQYFAYELTKKCASDSEERFAGTLVDAQVDLNPHQIDAALFAFQSPLSKGALLADEVGLGKTIEAGLLIAQKWAEHKRSILIITPANLRKQWFQEITEKFFIPCEILETKSYNADFRKGTLQPFRKSQIIICSYHFAKNKASEVSSVPWDLVVIDEAHRLRNVYKPTNIMANTLKLALMSAPKLLLTATPLQNSILELFGLVSFIDEHIFGDVKTFREHYSYLDEQDAFNELKHRLKPVCHRTLRRQVEPYIKFTKRFPILQEFSPEENEDKLYNLVSEYLRRDNLQALPAGQRSLIILVMRKLMASSSYAIAGALETIIKRLLKRIAKQDETVALSEEFAGDIDCFDEDTEELETVTATNGISPEDLAAIKNEVKDLQSLQALASSIQYNAKGRALLIALEKAFKQADILGAPRKAIIFTESRKTQSYIQRVLMGTPYGKGIVLFNGSNTDEDSRMIYKNWAIKNAGTDKVTGSRTADMRTAIVDYFKDEGSIMIATEAGAEGINLQFCSLVVNYDLPWNPQRIEQRIGRCHRYGQKHDVVVVNFLNNKNAADQRVYELLNDKFHLFEGIFGASDEVLGAIESGVDFEKRIVDIYQNCRAQEEINKAFDDLQLDLMDLIDETVTKSRQKLLENFDDEVRQKLKLRDDKSSDLLSRYEQQLMQLSKHELDGYAEFNCDSGFVLHTNPFTDLDIPLGLYELPRRSGDAFLYRLSHPLATKLIDKAKKRTLPPALVEFTYDPSQGRSFALEQFIGKEGYLSLALLSAESFEQTEEYLLLSAATIDGEMIAAEDVQKLFKYSGRVAGMLDSGEQTQTEVKDKIAEDIKAQTDIIRQDISKRNAMFFDAEALKIESWSEDLKNGLEYEIKDIDKKMKEVRKQSRTAVSLEDKLNNQKELRTLEASRNSKRRTLFEAQDKIDAQRENLIKEIEAKLRQQLTSKEIFQLRWVLYG